MNWHDRSLAPERLWGGCYRELVQDLKNRGAWFATGGQAVAWFRKRRSVVFEEHPMPQAGYAPSLRAMSMTGLPGVRVQVHQGQN